MKRIGFAITAGIVLAGLTGCDQSTAERSYNNVPLETNATLQVAEPLAADGVVTVYKSPTCGCCTKWASYLEANGFNVVTRDIENLDLVKDRLNVPYDLRSCHTATFGKHVVEGHVPVGDIRRWLDNESGGLLAVPGMPLGSPGMEHPRGGVAYDSIFVSEDGSTRRVFEHHPSVGE